MKTFFKDGEKSVIDFNAAHLCVYCNTYIRSKNWEYHNSGVKHRLNVKSNKKHFRRVSLGNGVYENQIILPETENVSFDRPVFIRKSCIRNNK